MVWEWSYSDEGLNGIKDNIAAQPRKWLEECWAEWQGAYNFRPGREPQLSAKKYDAALVKAKNLPDDILAEAIWKKASEQADCSNGAHNAYCCPWGCHAVTPDAIDGWKEQVRAELERRTGGGFMTIKGPQKEMRQFYDAGHDPEYFVSWYIKKHDIQEIATNQAGLPADRPEQGH